MRLGEAILLLAAVCAGMALAEAFLAALEAFDDMERRIAALEDGKDNGERVLQVP